MPLKFKVSVKDNLIGKGNLADQLGVWEHREMTPTQLAQHCYIEGKAYCHGIFDNERFLQEPLHYHTSRANHFFLEAQVVTVDIDAKDFDEEPFVKDKEQLLEAAQLDKILENEFVRRHCFLIVPSSGNRIPDKPNWHLMFLLKEPIKTPEEYRQVALAVSAQIPLPTDHQTAKAAQLTAGTRFKDPERHALGYRITDLYINDDAEPIDPEALSRYSVVPSKTETLKTVLRAANYGETAAGSVRSERHYAQPLADREKLVLECLRFVLPMFKQPQEYELWLQVWMAAWDGSHDNGKPSERVRDYILDHPDVHWSDGNEGKRKFYNTWNNHTNRAEGQRYTVASLFYLATQQGWLNRTGYEIDSWKAEIIDVEHISDWLAEQETIPERLLLQSQTGSGKTETLIRLWHRLDRPKTVVFVPTVKLAIELHGRLVKAGLPAVLYIDHKGRRLSREELLEAQVLVTTLQTFSMKAEGDYRVMHRYGLVYIEESDQLFSQFARGGGSALYQSSHVSEPQAQAGFVTLYDALQNSRVVWMVDATMTKVSWQVAEQLSSKPVRYVLNTNVRRKAAVHMLSEMSEAYAVVLSSVMQGKRVVVAADKASRAKEIVDVMLKLGVLDEKKYILLTKDTEQKPEVQEFMEDVEAGAAQYDLVAYNSVMASGVSIQNTTPDVVVQFCEYLTPRNNLQILNRYRSQDMVYCYYHDGENFYRKSAEEIIEAAGHRVELEQRTVAVPAVPRNDLSEVRKMVASVSAADEDMQKRSPRQLYMALLKQDGRRVFDAEEEPLPEHIKHTISGIRRANRENRDEIMTYWRSVEPVTPDNPPDADATDIDVAKGKLHGLILRRLGYLPTDAEKYRMQMEAFFERHEISVDREHAFDRYIAEVVTQFSNKEFLLTALTYQDRAISLAERYLTDAGKPITAFMNFATQAVTVMTVRHLFHNLDEVVLEDEWGCRSEKFLEAVEHMREHYDMMFDRGRYKYDEINRNYPEPIDRAERMAAALLARAGLKLKVSRLQGKGSRVGGKQKRGFYIVNLAEAEAFLDWKYAYMKDEAKTLSEAWRDDLFEKRRRENEERFRKFHQLPERDQKWLLKILAEDNGHTRFSELMDMGATGTPL